jgi:hypothetical protein
VRHEPVNEVWGEGKVEGRSGRELCHGGVGWLGTRVGEGCLVSGGGTLPERSWGGERKRWVKKTEPRGERKRSWGERDDGKGVSSNRLRGWCIVGVFFSSVIQWNQGLRFLEKDKLFVLAYFGWFYIGTNHKG